MFSNMKKTKHYFHGNLIKFIPSMQDGPNENFGKLHKKQLSHLLATKGITNLYGVFFNDI